MVQGRVPQFWAVNEPARQEVAVGPSGAAPESHAIWQWAPEDKLAGQPPRLPFLGTGTMQESATQVWVSDIVPYQHCR
jgi:hypothetical protein